MAPVINVKCLDVVENGIVIVRVTMIMLATVTVGLRTNWPRQKVNLINQEVYNVVLFSAHSVRQCL